MSGPHHEYDEVFREAAGEIVREIGKLTIQEVVRSLQQLAPAFQNGLRYGGSLADLPPVDHRMLGREPLFPDRGGEAITLKPLPTGEDLVENIRQAMASAWSPPPLTSADLYADWRYRCAQHAKQRY